MTANNDFLKEQAPLMTAALERCGVPCVYRCYGDETQKLGACFPLQYPRRGGKKLQHGRMRFFQAFYGMKGTSL